MGDQPGRAERMLRTVVDANDGFGCLGAFLLTICLLAMVGCLLEQWIDRAYPECAACQEAGE